MMSTNYSSQFNFAADKVVALREWKAKTDALYKTELTTGEKAFLYLVDIPVSVVAGLVMAFTAKSKKPAVYFDMEKMKLYVSGEYANDTSSNAPFTASRAFDAKTGALAAQAFAECEDHSKKPIMQRLKKL